MVQGAVETAIAAGYRHIDTAFCYKNEQQVGKAVQAKIKQGIIKREDMFVVSKVRKAQPPKQSFTFISLANEYLCFPMVPSDSCGAPFTPRRTSLCVWTSPWLTSSWTTWTFTSYTSLLASRLSVCPTQCGTLDTNLNALALAAES